MGRESRANKERLLRKVGEYVYTSAEGVKEEDDMQQRMAAIGMVVPSLSTPPPMKGT